MPHISTTLTNHILRIQLTRPGKQNALTPAMYDAPPAVFLNDQERGRRDILIGLLESEFGQRSRCDMSHNSIDSAGCQPIAAPLTGPFLT